jgi:lambda family phage tail tape measure protein
MARNRIEELLVQLKFEGSEELRKVASGFRDLGRATTLTDTQIQSARRQINDYAKSLNNSEQALKGQIQALQTLRTQATVGGNVYSQLANDVTRLSKTLKGLEEDYKAVGRASEQTDRQIANQFPARRPEAFRVQIAALRRELDGLSVSARAYGDQLTQITIRETAFGRAQARQGVIAGAQAVGAPLIGSMTPQQALPNTTAALRLRLTELRDDLQNTDYALNDYKNTLKEIEVVQKELDRVIGEANKTRKEEIRDRIANLKAINEENAALRQQSAVAGSIARNRAGKEATAGRGLSGAMFGPQGPSEMFRSIGAIIDQPALNTAELMGRTYGEVAQQIRSVAASSDGSINSLQRQRTAWQQLRTTISPLSADYGKVAKEADQAMAAIDRQVQRMQGRRRMSAMEATQAAGAVISGGIFGGPEGAAGGIAGTVVGGVPGAFAGAAIGAQFGMIRQAIGSYAEMSAEINQLRQGLAASSNNFAEFIRLVQMTEESSKRLLIPLAASYRIMAQLRANTVELGYSLEDTRMLFEGTATAVFQTGGNLNDVQGAMRAIVQVLSKGRPQAEEIRSQLGERLPGAIIKFAQETGRSTEELEQAFKDSAVTVDDFFKFAKRNFKDGEGYFDNLATNAEFAGRRYEKSLENIKLTLGRTFQTSGAAFQDFATRYLGGLDRILNKLIELRAIQPGSQFFVEQVLSGGINIEDLEQKVLEAGQKYDRLREVMGNFGFLSPSLGDFKSEAKSLEDALIILRRFESQSKERETQQEKETKQKEQERLAQSFLQAIEQRNEAIDNARKQREEQLAQIREQAVEQAEQIETQLADRRLAIERQIQDITRQRSESAEDSERRIRAARGENAGLIEAEQKIVDIFREERESRIDSERRLADDTKEQEETIANFQKGVAKNINDANRAHTRSMGEIQKRYATAVAKIIDEGAGKAGKRLVVAGELLQRMLDRANLSQVRASVNYGGGYLPPIPKPRTVGGTLSYPGFERDPAAVPEKFKQLDRQILDLERKLQASRLNGIGQQFTALLGAEGGYEDLAMTRGQAAIIIKKLEAAAVQRNITPDAFATALQEIGDLAQSPDASRRTIRNLMATPGAGIAVRSPGLLRNLATRQLSQDQANIQASGVNPASLTKQIEPMLAIIGQLQKDNLLRKNVSLSETKEQIQKPLYAALMDWVKANLNNTQLQEILERSIMGGNVDTYGAKGLLPLAAGFKPASFGVGLTPAAIKADQEAEARRRYEATPVGRAEKAREEEYARKFREIQMKLGPRSEAIGPGSFDTVKIATDFGEIASASFINGLLAQNSGVSRPYQVGDYVGGSPSAPPARLRPPVIPSAPATTQLRNKLAQREAQARQAKTAQLVKEAFADINAEAAQFTNGLNDQLRLLQDQRKYLDMGFSDSLSRDLANLDKGLMDREAVIRRTTDQLILSVQAAGGDPTAANAAYAAEVARSREIYDLQVKITQELEKQTEAIRLRQDDRIGMGVREGALAYVESIGTMREATAQLTQTGIKGVEDALFSLVTTGTANFREFAAEILKQSARMILQLTIQRVLMQIIGAIGGGSTNLGSSAANVAQYAPLPNAMGNAFASNNIIPYANGGIVNRPTMFKFARGGAMATGVMGEAGPEAIMPLKRGADGKLGVASAGGSNVTVNVSVDAKGTQVQGDPGQGAQLGRVIAGAVQQELIKQQRPGGLLAGAK